LFACFESYHGNKNEAVSQIFAGTEMVGEYLRVKAAEERGNTTLSRPGLEESIYMTFVVVEIQAMTIGGRKWYAPIDDIHDLRPHLLMKDLVRSGTRKE
jgi:hypothetical protein